MAGIDACIWSGIWRRCRGGLRTGDGWAFVMAKMQRDKGQRRERELVHKHRDIGIKSERVSDFG